MFRFSFSLIFFTFFLYRFQIFSIPYFQTALTTNPLVNYFCGIFSDLSFLCLHAALWLAYFKIPETSVKKLISRGCLIWALTLLVFHICAIHYLEYFGMNVRVFHLRTLSNGSMWSTGTGMIVDSSRALTILFGAPLLILLFSRYSKKIENIVLTWSSKKTASAVLIFLFISAAFNSAMISVRSMPGMHKELRSHPLIALYYDYKRNQDLSFLPPPNSKERLVLRSLLGGNRDYFETDSEINYPLWQKKMTSTEKSVQDSSERELKEFIKSESEAKGPWNVVLLISESLRAYDLDAFNSGGAFEEDYKNGTPFLTSLVNSSISFTETYAIGFTTESGQLASQCSLLGVDGTTLMNSAPLSRMICLGDVFKSKGYTSEFFYPSDNHFDNQDIFYRHHGFTKVHGDYLMPKDGATGGWGLSDFELYKYTLSRLEELKRPFFATVLNITNHGPFKMPEDAPKHIRNSSRPMRPKIFSYVDWAMGRFHGSLLEKFPHTIFIMVADHGHRRGTPGKKTPSAKDVRKAARIPFIISIGGLPKGLRGAKIDRLGSIIDIPPTLLSIMGWQNTAQSFMGENAFNRSSPIYIDWNRKLLGLESPSEGAIQVKYAGKRVDKIISQLGRYNFIAPSLESKNN
jgi:hypothetical protein